MPLRRPRLRAVRHPLPRLPRPLTVPQQTGRAEVRQRPRHPEVLRRPRHPEVLRRLRHRTPPLRRIQTALDPCSPVTARWANPDRQNLPPASITPMHAKPVRDRHRGHPKGGQLQMRTHRATGKRRPCTTAPPREPGDRTPPRTPPTAPLPTALPPALPKAALPKTTTDHRIHNGTGAPAHRDSATGPTTGARAARIAMPVGADLRPDAETSPAASRDLCRRRSRT